MEHYYGVYGLIILILDIYAIVQTINSSRDAATKVLWIILILVLPVFGFIAWLFMGPRS